jgi:anti-anti-sigma regulatory factor
MLRITHIGGNGRPRVLKLEGRLVDQWVELLEETCQRHLSDLSSQLILDLSGLEFAGRSGIELLRRLEKQGVTCTHASPFLRSLWE